MKNIAIQKAARTAETHRSQIIPGY